MEFTNPFAPSRQERFPFQSEVDRLAADPDPGANTRLSRNVSLGNNFSYPRLSRHESSESRSSEGSMPGMTDASDSDISFDEDCIYNTSANELWDSFWPDKTAPSICRQSQEEHLALLRARRRGDDSKFRLRRRRQPSDVVDDTIVIASGIPDPNVEEPGSPRHMFQPPASQPTPKKSAVTYSVYPKLPAINVHPHPHPHPHPPRTSSLGFEPPAPPQRPLFLRGCRSSAGLKSSKSTHNINALFIPPSLAKPAPSQQPSPSTAKTASSVPVSPAYPPPPPPKTLRPSTSAFNLRDRARHHSASSASKGLASHAAPAPLTPLLPSPLPAPRPQVERFVSVFELDSDSDGEADVDESSSSSSSSFARRIARGLHKKSGSDKRGLAERKLVAAGLTALDADASDKDLPRLLRSKNGASLSRRRGGSLGRIFGLIR